MRRRRFLGLALILTLQACAPRLPRAPMLPGDDPAFAPPEVVDLPGLEQDPPQPMTLFPGDVLAVRSISVESFEAQNLMVDASGNLHVPLAGSVRVLGLELSDAETKVADAVRSLDRFAKVSLTVTKLGGHRATVVGAVQSPGVFTLEPNTRLAEVLATAGGTKVESAGEEMVDVADLDAARLVRDGRALPVSLGKALRGEPRHNVLLRPGDLVYVPSTRSQRVTVLGSVGKARAFSFRPGMRLTEALALAGGPTVDADNGDVRVIRGPLSRPAVYRARIDELVAGKSHDVVLAAGDVVFVTEHWFATTGRVISRLTPLLAAAALGAALSR